MPTVRIILEADTKADLEAALAWLAKTGATISYVTSPCPNLNTDDYRRSAVLSTPSSRELSCHQIEAAQRFYREFVANGNEKAAAYWLNVIDTIEENASAPVRAASRGLCQNNLMATMGQEKPAIYQFVHEDDSGL